MAKQCSSSYAFAVTGALESLLTLQAGPQFDLALLTPFPTPFALSTQQLIDCDENNQGCEGGWPDYSWQYLTTHSLPYNFQYGYTASNGTCKANAFPDSSPLISAFEYVPTDDEQALQEVSHHYKTMHLKIVFAPPRDSHSIRPCGDFNNQMDRPT